MANIGGQDYKELDWIAETAQIPGTNNFHRFCDWWDYHQDLKQMEKEVRKVTSIRTGLGWSQAKMFKRIGSMPLHVFNALRKVDPEFGRNSPEGRKKMHRFLMRHPEYGATDR